MYSQMHNIHPHVLPASHLYIFIHICIFLIALSRHVEVFTSDYSHHVMKEGHSDLPMSTAE
jgi:hypothetical protein